MPLATPTILLGFLLPWAWGISSRLLQQSEPLLLTLDEGYLLTATLPDLQCGIAPLGPPVPVQPPLRGRGLIFPAAVPGLGHGVAPPDRCPNLGCGVALPGHRP